MNLAATLDLAEAAGTEWDALIVGAGPAGAVTARELARLGTRVLLVDQAAFPRRKVCGSCLIQRGVDTLSRIGLGDLPRKHGAVPLTSVQLSARNCHATFPGPGGVALSREVLDAALVEAAIFAGAHFLPEALARLHESDAQIRSIKLHRFGDTRTVRARVMVAADGLGGLFLAREPGMAERVRPAARIGVGCTLEDGTDHYKTGTVYMTCGRAGYVGLVRVENGRLNCAAALDRKALRHAAGPAPVVASLFQEAGLPIPVGLEAEAWRGTMPLTRTLPRSWSHRLFVVGDAAGYVEPFTGEGMAWGLASAVTLAPIVRQAAAEWNPALGNDWQKQHRKLVDKRERFLKGAAFVLRHPLLTRGVVALLSQFPSVAAPFVRHLQQEDRVG